MLITSSEKFAAYFNMKIPGAYRMITGQDVRDMIECGLVRKYGGYYSQADLERIRAILQYEQMREKRPTQPTLEDKQEPPKCKRCKQPLPLEPEGTETLSRL